MMSTIDGGHYQTLHHAVRAGKTDGYITNEGIIHEFTIHEDRTLCVAVFPVIGRLDISSIS
jgi:hypothetical protein